MRVNYVTLISNIEILIKMFTFECFHNLEVLYDNTTIRRKIKILFETSRFMLGKKIALKILQNDPSVAIKVRRYSIYM